jgi:alkyl sulfatase BDS1-like metallo-beta-lactamase superfamily hydrolase
VLYTPKTQAWLRRILWQSLSDEKPFFVWFNGDTVNLYATDPEIKNARFVKLMGDRDKVMAAAEEAFKEDDPQFSTELTSMLISIDKEDMQARYLKAAGAIAPPLIPQDGD